jgi:hypothetical protein
MKAKTLLATALAATLGYGTYAQAYIVDLFDDPAANGVNVVTDTTVGGGGDFEEYPGGAVPSTSIIGGYRDIIADTTASDGIGTPRTELEVGGGGMSFSTSSGDTGIGTIQWDGRDGSSALDATGLGGLDLINQPGCPLAGCNAFVAQVLVADQGFFYQIGVYSGAANYSILTATTQFAVASLTEADYLFDWFLLASGDYLLGGLPFNIQRVGSGPDFTNIGALEFRVNQGGAATAAVDLAIDSITKRGVPEPNVLALMAIGGFAVSLAGRRRKTRKA